MKQFDLDDAECNRILAMSSEQVRAHVEAQGLHPDKVVEEVDRVVKLAKVEAYRRRMKLFV